MKTIETIADEKSKRYGYESVDKLIRDGSRTAIYAVMKEAAEEYAKQMCDLQIDECAERASENSRQSVYETPNVAEKP